MIFQPSRRSARDRRNVFAIRTPSGGLVRVGPKNERDARSAVNAFVRARWPLTWKDLHAQGYRVEAIAA
jgi:hypothetical protein